MSIRKHFLLTVSLISINAFSANVIPNCNASATPTLSKLNPVYAGVELDFYIPGFEHQFLALSKNQCLSSEDPGVYQTTLMLRKDGELVNYVYDEQNDLTYVAFASNTSGLGVEYALFYLDTHSAFKYVMLELLDAKYRTVQTITPLATKSTQNEMKGTLELGSILQLQQAVVQGLSTYDNANGQLYQYTFTPKPVKYVDVFFAGHTLETRDAHYQITILDGKNRPASPMAYVCQIPFAESDCFGKVKLITPSHYLVYLEDSNNIEIAKFSQLDHSKRAIYFNGINGMFLGWNSAEAYNIDFNAIFPKAYPPIFSWSPLSAKYYGTFYLFSWEDHPSVPDGSYKSSCDMDSMVFERGILKGACYYIDNFDTKHWVTSSLNYDQLCKKDPAENDLVANDNGYLSCQ